MFGDQICLSASLLLAGPHPRSLSLRRSKTRYPRAGRGRFFLLAGESRIANREPRTSNREPRTANREPRTANREPRTANRDPLLYASIDVQATENRISGVRFVRLAGRRERRAMLLVRPSQSWPVGIWSAAASSWRRLWFCAVCHLWLR